MENIQKKYIFAVLGGDRRQATVANELVKLGHGVKLFGLSEYTQYCAGAEQCLCLEKAIEESNAVILPIPVTRDGATLAAPPSAPIELGEIVRLAAKYGVKTVFGGVMPKEFEISCQINGIEPYDYYTDEALQRKNALPSAEGAIMIAMENTEITLSGMNVLISGYGRIGALLASMLKRMGANVTVAARRDEILCEIILDGHRAVKIDPSSEIGFVADYEYDVIFNTVPSVIFTEKVIKDIKNKPLYIEIASQPGGIEQQLAGRVGIKTVFAPSLPGRYSPVSAGKYIFETISKFLLERGIAL